MARYKFYIVQFISFGLYMNNMQRLSDGASKVSTV